MIGQLIFWNAARRHTATLTDHLDWTCDDPAVADELNRNFPGHADEEMSNLVVGRHLLYQTAERLGGKVHVPLRRRPQAAAGEPELV